MMRFIGGIFSGVEGVRIYPIFSLLVFFIFFIVLFWKVVRMDNSTIEEIKKIPLNDK